MGTEQAGVPGKPGALHPRRKAGVLAALMVLSLVLVLSKQPAVGRPNQGASTAAPAAANAATGTMGTPQGTGRTALQPAGASARSAVARVPLAFEPNVGQASAPVLYVAHLPGGVAAFAGSGLTLTLNSALKTAPAARQVSSVQPGGIAGSGLPAPSSVPTAQAKTAPGGALPPGGDSAAAPTPS